MNIENSNEMNPLASLQALIARHGALAIGAAYLRAALKRRQHPPDSGIWHLSDHMRRDIGLPTWADRPDRWR